MDYGLDTKSTRLKTFNTIFIITWLLIACFPFVWTFWGSFKVRADFFSRSDWWYAISAFNTLIETGGQFTTNAYTQAWTCLLYTSPSPRDQRGSRMPSSA